MIWSDNIDPVNMVRLVNPEPMRLPYLLRYFGPFASTNFSAAWKGILTSLVRLIMAKR